MKLRARADHPQRFTNLRFTDFMADPTGSVEGVCADVGIALDGAIIDRMRGWLIDNPPGKHGSNRYAPEDFGLTAAQIRKRFDYYQDY